MMSDNIPHNRNKSSNFSRENLLTAMGASDIVGRKMFHFGQWLQNAVAARGKPTVEFAKEAKVSPSRLYDWFKEPSPELLTFKLAGLATALGIEFSEINKLYLQSREGVPPRGRRSRKRSSSISKMLSPGMPMSEEGDVIGYDGKIVNIERPDPKLIANIPIINRVAAGNLSEYTDLGYPGGVADEFVAAAVGDLPAFGLWVHGDSMSPRYESGDLVIFKCVDPERQKVVDGGDYAVQFDGSGDGESTFKRLYKTAQPWIVIARPINPKWRPKQMKIDLRQVIRMGIAIDVRLRKPR